MKNKDLKKVYDNVFASGENNFWSFEPIEIHEQVLSLPIYKDKKVLDVGCGSGDVAIGISELGAKSVLGIDYSDEAIKQGTTADSDLDKGYQGGGLVMNYGDYGRSYK